MRWCRSTRTRLSGGRAALLLACSLPACTAAAGLPAPALARASADPAESQAMLVHCVTQGAAALRSATFSGQMTAVPGTRRMAIRIDVQERVDGANLFHTVTAPGFGIWHGSEPGVKIYKYVDQVTNLGAAGSYRALVRFRWMSARGRVIRLEAHRTLACHEPPAQLGPAGTGPAGTPPASM